MKVIVATRPSGEVNIIYPCDCGLSIDQIAEKDCDGLPYEIVEHDTLPQDRIFRSAWRKTRKGDAVKVSMAHARNQAHELRRAERAKKMAPYDIEVTIPGKQESAEAARQSIRDADAKLQDAIMDVDTTEKLLELMRKSELI